MDCPIERGPSFNVIVRRFVVSDFVQHLQFGRAQGATQGLLAVLLEQRSLTRQCFQAPDAVAGGRDTGVPSSLNQQVVAQRPASVKLQIQSDTLPR